MPIYAYIFCASNVIILKLISLHFTFLANKCTTTLPVFLGLTYVNVYCYSCDDCLDDIEKILIELNGKHNDQDDVTMFNNDDVSCEKLHRKNCPDCNSDSKLKIWVNGLICHRGRHN